uniref:SGNH hydrolase-type esterase domain-containing protein n=1 Tax=Salix viminalis TaxID=40686 RepID=A0A6N2KGL4_SALVM
MERDCTKQHLLQHLLRLLFCLLIFVPDIFSKALQIRQLPTIAATAVIVFGDSTVDPGNNNYVKTVFRANFAPYGQDFANQVPTGRFSNGRLTTDFVASYIGIKESVPPYLDPTLSIDELLTGVSFASAGSGFDPLTPKNVIDIPKQLEYFKEYKKDWSLQLERRRRKIISRRQMFIVSAGTNDFVINYFTLPIRRKTYSISGYQQLILQTATQFVQEQEESYSVDYLRWAACPSLSPFSRTMPFQNVVVLIISPPLEDSHSFDEVSLGCCGTGYMETAILCNPKSYLCPDASKYVFWDSIHPTEQTYSNVFKSLRPIVDAVIRD